MILYHLFKMNKFQIMSKIIKNQLNLILLSKMELEKLLQKSKLLMKMEVLKKLLEKKVKTKMVK